MFKKIIIVTMATGLMLMSSVGAFASTSPQETQDMLYDPELGYEVDLDHPSGDTLGCPYVEGLGYEVSVDDEALFTGGFYDSGWKDYLGGKWRHGVNTKHVWSKYDHASKTHKTTVRGAGGKYAYSGWIAKGKRASASSESALLGNKAWADTK